MRKFLALLTSAALLIAIMPLMSLAQGASDLVVTTVDDTDYPTLRLFLEGTRASYDTALGTADFNVTINGVETPIQSVEAVRNDDVPINVVLVVDTSQSMFGAPLDNTKQAITDFAERLNPDDQLAVIAFADRARVIRDFSSASNGIADVNALGAIGRTALYDAVVLAADTAANAPSDRTVIVFLTDGNEFGNLSNATVDDALARSQATGIPYFIIGLGYDLDTIFLNAVALSTGGDFYESPSPDELASVYDLLASYLRTEYVLTVAPALEPNGDTADIQVTQGDATTNIAYEIPDLLPQVVVANAPTEAIEAPTTLQLEIATPRGIGDISASINGQAVTVVETSNDGTNVVASLDIDPTLADGETTLEIVVTDAEGGNRSTSIPLNLAAPLEITLEGLQDNAQIFLPRPISIDVNSGVRPLQSVSYQVDDGDIQTVDGASFLLDIISYTLGDHQITVTGSAGSQTVRVERTFTILPVPTNADWEVVTRELASVTQVLVPAGCFVMGGDLNTDEQPLNDTCVNQAFWLDATPVTNAQYGSTGLFTGESNPRDRLTWYQAQSYCAARGGRLPTEAEWEFAARGPDNLIYPWGNLYEAGLAVNIANSDGSTQPVGTRNNASWTGALDMSGNIWEWTSSLYTPYPYDANDGREDAAMEDLRVLRGGSATNRETDLTTFNRFPKMPNTSSGLTGVRCAFDYE